MRRPAFGQALVKNEVMACAAATVRIAYYRVTDSQITLITEWI